MNPTRSQARPAFTLIELVVVLVILAAIAALLVAKLGFIQGQADSASGGAGAAQLMSNLETYKVSVGGYPLGLDTLLQDGGAAVYSGLWRHTSSFGSTGLGAGDLVAATVSSGGTGSGYAQSFGHAFAPPAGGYYFFDHDGAADPTHSATVQRTFAAASSQNVAHVAPAAASLIRAAGFPGGVLPSGVKLVAFGIGSNNAAVGTTMASVPRHTAQANEYYGRYIALFAIYNSGKTGELRTIVDSFGRSIDANVSSYKRSAPDKPSTP